MSKKKPRKITFVTFSQSIFLTIKYFFQNRLLSFAGSCAFSFLFSVIPLFIMIIMVLVRILHASPNMVSSIMSALPELQKYFDSDLIISSVQSIKTVTTFEIVAGLFIFWMARRFFASIFDSMQNIFHTQTRRRAVWNQVLAFLMEILIVIVISALIFAYISIHTISTLPIFKNIPQLSFFFNSFLSGDFILKLLPNIMIFVALIPIYKTSAGTKPSFLLCTFNSLLCTFSFWGFRILLHFFLDVNQYTRIYGVLGHAIILFMDIFFFFVFFLIFAQIIYVMQFFDELLLGELYLLPKIEQKGLGANIKRSMFIRPDFLMAKDRESLLLFKPGDYIFHAGDKDNSAYYIIRGSVKFLEDENNPEKYKLAHRGAFFGEKECILNEERKLSAIAVLNTSIIKIESQRFRFLVHQNPEAARKVLRQISPYFE